jgi:uncharacterized protein (DUF433 family)
MLTIPNIEQIVVQDGDILGGIPVFVGTRVPVQTLFDYLEAGQPLDEFLDDFPTVRREQATQLLAVVKKSLPSLIRQ